MTHAQTAPLKLLLLIIVSILMSVGPLNGREITIGGGSKTGNYLKVAEALAERMRVHCEECEIEARVTQGSYDNANLLQTGTITVALLQIDTAYVEHFRNRNLVALASIYVEPLHVVARRELGLESLSEIATERPHLRAGIGPRESGTSSHALLVLDELRSRRVDVEHHYLPFQESLDRLRDRELDLVFLTAAAPVASLVSLAEDRVSNLLDVDGEIARQLLQRNPFFRQAEIPFDVYPISEESIQTLGTTTLLVGRRDLADEVVRDLLRSLYDLPETHPQLAFLSSLSVATGLRSTEIPVHPASLRFHRRRTGSLTRLFEFGRRYGLPILVLLIPLLVLFRLSKVAFFLHRFRLGRILVVLIGIWLVGAAGMHLVEGSKSVYFSSYGRSAIAILHYLFSGLESRFPVTLGGNVIAILVLSLGVGVVTYFTATLVTLLMEKVLDVNKVPSKPWRIFRLKDHTVFVGWSPHAERVLSQLRSPDLVKKPQVVVTAPKNSRAEFKESTLKNVWLVEGDLASQDTLERADIDKARSVVIFSGSEASRLGDMASVSYLMAIEKSAQDIHTIVELHQQKNFEYLTHRKADEIVTPEIVGERMVTQCTVSPGLMDIYDELLSFGRDSQEVYLEKAKWIRERVPYRSLYRGLAHKELILVGYQLNGEAPVLNPRMDRADQTISGADRLIFMADRGDALGSGRDIELNVEVDGNEVMTMEDSDQASSTRLRRERRVEVGICGWNEEARAIVEQLRETVVVSHQEFALTVICEPESADFETERNGDLHDGVRFVIGDASRRKVLENAGITRFDGLIILADRSDEVARQYSDHRALMIALAASDLRPDIHIVAEILHSINREHLERLRNVEIVSVQDLGEKLLAQAVISPGITGVYLELLTATEDSNEIYIVSVPPEWIDQPFEEVYLTLAEEGSGVTPLGYRSPSESSPQRPEVILNPHKEKKLVNGVESWWKHRLKEEDELVVMAYEEPEW